MDILTKTNLTAGGETTTDLLTSSKNIVNKEGVSELISDNNTYFNRLLDSKVEIADIDDYIYKNATPISSNDDLNDYVIPGKYYAGSDTIAETLENCPFSNNGFTLVVEGQYNGNNYIGQTIISNSPNSFLKLFRRLTVSSNSWSDWYKVSGYCAASYGSNRSSISVTSSTSVQVQLNTLKFRTVTKFTLNDYDIYVPYAGIAIVTGGAYITAATSNYQQRAAVFIQHRRNDEVLAEYSNYGTGIGSISTSGIFSVLPNDSFRLYARCYDGSGSVMQNANGTHLDVAYL